MFATFFLHVRVLLTFDDLLIFIADRGDDLYDLFGRYGAIRQVRLGNENKSKGTAFVVYEDVMDASRSVLSLP